MGQKAPTIQRLIQIYFHNEVDQVFIIIISNSYRSISVLASCLQNVLF